MHNKYKKYCTIHNTNTVVYTAHSGSYSTECKRKYTTHWYTRGTQQLQRYTTFTAAHNIQSGAQHIQDTETFGHQVASIMISLLAL